MNGKTYHTFCFEAVEEPSIDYSLFQKLDNIELRTNSRTHRCQTKVNTSQALRHTARQPTTAQPTLPAATTHRSDQAKSVVLCSCRFKNLELSTTPGTQAFCNKWRQIRQYDTLATGSQINLNIGVSREIYVQNYYQQ